MITLHNVSKYYLTNKGRNYILRNVSLSIGPNEKVGVLGRNGAGKSTLLRLFAGVDIPDEGTIVRSGSISWPMGLATGLQAPLTGRENARFACRIQGLGRHRTEDKLKFIHEFSEIGEYFEMPVRTYSSGMRARLNFAIAMAFQFDFYIIDELTSVGDQLFRKKSQKVFKEKREKCGFIKVSHNLDELVRECDSGLLLEDGKLVYYPVIKDAVADYKSSMAASTRKKPAKAAGKRKPAAKKTAKAGPAKKARKAAAAKKPASVPGQRPALVTRSKPKTAPPARQTAARAPHRPAPMMPRSAASPKRQSP